VEKNLVEVEVGKILVDVVNLVGVEVGNEKILDEVENNPVEVELEPAAIKQCEKLANCM